MTPHFAIERFLPRLSRSACSDHSVLKGALVLHAWDLPGGRPKRDIDLRTMLDYPALPDAPAPRLRAYLQPFNGNRLAKALAATFERRATPLLRTHLASFGGEWIEAKRDLWAAFTLRLPRGHRPPHDLGGLVRQVAHFVEPALRAAVGREGLEKRWPAGGPWR